MGDVITELEHGRKKTKKKKIGGPRETHLTGKIRETRGQENGVHALVL